VLLAKLESLPRDLARRAEIAARYDRAFAEYLELQARPAGTVSANAAYAILHDSRNALQDELAKQGIATRIYYEKPLHQLSSMRRFSEGLPSLPVCERLSRQILHLPIYPELSDEAVERVCEAVLEALTKQPGTRQQQQIARQA
jgi:UDP-2-acetamido-2-deoxy-ribo-hexuluronate aminotransferase